MEITKLLRKPDLRRGEDRHGIRDVDEADSFPAPLTYSSVRRAMWETRPLALVVCTFLLILLSSPLALAAGSFTPTANMATSRFSHTMTLLPGGNVLVAGAASHPAFPSAELYDPLSRTFSPASGMSPRIGHTSTLLPNESVLIAGGTGELAFSTAEIYDPQAGTFTATGSMTTTRAFATASLLPNGEVLVAGGYQFNHPISAQSSAELYQPAASAFTTTGSMTGSRTNHTATLLPNGTVLVVGGIDATQFSGLTTAEIYDPASQTFTPTGALSQGRGFHTATLLPNGNVLIAGGTDGFPGPGLSSTEIYDASTHSFSPGPDMSVRRGDHVASALADGTVLIAGGFTDTPFGGQTLSSAEIYDPDTRSIVPAGDMGTPRGRHAAAALANGDVLITGGISQCCSGLESGEVFSISAPPLIIDSDTVLTGDHSGPVVVAADGITLDCQRHSISGPGAIGISMDGRKNVTIRECVVSGFDVGFSLTSASENRLLDNTANGNIEIGFYLDGSNENVLSTNRANNNGASGLVLVGATRNSMIRNTFDANGQFGVHLLGSDANEFMGNTASGSGIHGWYLDGSNKNVFVGNAGRLSEAAGFSMEGSSTENTMEGNTATDNAGNGFRADETAGNNVLLRNVAQRNDTGYAIFGDSTRLEGNVARHNAADGFFLDMASENLLTLNLALLNESAGFRTGGSANGNSFIRNVACRNGQQDGAADAVDEGFDNIWLRNNFCTTDGI